jgi:putative membrane protein, TIGR04086 family
MNIKDLGKLNTRENLKKSNYIYILRGIIVSVLITMLGLLIFSIILTKTNTSEATIFPVVVVITAISILIGSFIASGKIKNKGIVNGAIVGGCYMLVIYLLSSIMGNSFSLNVQSFVTIIAAIMAGIIGGILGVNLRK